MTVRPNRQPNRPASARSDALSDALRTVRLTGASFFLVNAKAPWVNEIPDGSVLAPILLPAAQQIVSYHIVTRGPCWAGLAGEPAVRLDDGDILLIPRGDAYFMSSAPGMRAEDPVAPAVEFFRLMAAGQLPSLLTEGGAKGEPTHLVCGFLGCDLRPFNPVLAALPRLVHLRRPAAAEADRLDHLVDFALAETREHLAGGRCVLLRLSELLFVEVLRRCLPALPEAQTGWLAGLRDPMVGRALALLHGRAAEAWTLARLAREVGVSRSTLAERFTALVGQSPMRYLGHWRMQLAARLLAEGAAKLHAVALEVGYDSEAAFSRAFKRMVGSAPAAWRRRSRKGPR